MNTKSINVCEELERFRKEFKTQGGVFSDIEIIFFTKAVLEKQKGMIKNERI